MNGFLLAKVEARIPTVAASIRFSPATTDPYPYPMSTKTGDRNLQLIEEPQLHAKAHCQWETHLIEEASMLSPFAAFLVHSGYVRVMRFGEFFCHRAFS